MYLEAHRASERERGEGASLRLCMQLQGKGAHYNIYSRGNHETRIAHACNKRED